MSSRQGFVLLLCSAALGGCAVGPDYHAPQLASSLPAQYHNAPADSPVITERWWTVFGDAALSRLVEQALTANLDIAQADARIRQARASVGQADSSLWPQLNADGRVGHDQFSRNSENFANIPFANPKSGFNDNRIGLDASWEIDLFGLEARQREAARAMLGSAQEQRNVMVLQVAAEVARNVIDYRGWQLRWLNAQQQLEAASSNLQLLTLLRQAGEVSDGELQQAAAVVHQRQAALPPLKTAQGQALFALTVLVDQPEQQIEQILAGDLPIPATLSQAPAGLPGELLQRRPDIRQAERELAAATARIGVAVAQQYPQLQLIGNAGWDSVHQGNLTSAASRYWSLGPQLSLPLFNAGGLQDQVKEKQAERDAALAVYRQRVLTALADTETALLRYAQEQQRQQQLQAGLQVAARQLQLAGQRYQVGETAQTEVLDLRQQYAQARELLLASQQAEAQNLVALFKALGGGIK